VTGPARILTGEEVVGAFGDPMPLLLEDGHVADFWPRRILGTAYLPAALPLSWDRSRMVRRFSCHRLLVKRFEGAFARIHAAPGAWDTVNDFGGCYAWRAVRGAKAVLSRHAWGIAVDMDVLDNPMRGEPHVHPAVVEAFAAEGFYWGGNFSLRRRDPMHFEFADLTLLPGGG